MKKGLSPQSCLAICHPRDVRECRRSNCFQVKIFLSTYCRNRRKCKTKFASQLSYSINKENVILQLCASLPREVSILLKKIPRGVLRIHSNIKDGGF